MNPAYREDYELVQQLADCRDSIRHQLEYSHVHF